MSKPDYTDYRCHECREFYQSEIRDLNSTVNDLVTAIEDLLESSNALAKATPGALAGVPNARQLHLADVAVRKRAAELVAKVKGEA